MILVLLTLAAIQTPDVDAFFQEHPRQAIQALREVASQEQVLQLRKKVILLEAKHKAFLRRRYYQDVLRYDENSAIVLSISHTQFMSDPAPRKLYALFKKHYEQLRPFLIAGLSAEQKSALIQRVRKWRRWLELTRIKQHTIDLGFEVSDELMEEIAANSFSLSAETQSFEDEGDD